MPPYGLVGSLRALSLRASVLAMLTVSGVFAADGLRRVATGAERGIDSMPEAFFAVVAGTFVLAPLLAAAALASGLLYAGSPLRRGRRALLDRAYVLALALVAGGFAVVHVLVLVPWMTSE